MTNFDRDIIAEWVEKRILEPTFLYSPYGGLKQRLVRLLLPVYVKVIYQR
jgi:hypothetical protein